MIWKEFMLWDKKLMIKMLKKRRSLIPTSMISGDWDYHSTMQFGITELVYVPTEEQLADGMTKALPYPTFLSSCLS